MILQSDGASNLAMTSWSSEEARQDCIKHMGPELGLQYHLLWQEVANLYLKWEQYIELFGSKPGRVDLLNKSAPTFFRVVQNVLWDEILLHIARLTDPATSMGKADRANLTVQNFPGLISREDVRASVLALIDEAKQKSEFCRHRRNRRLAHRDLDLAISETPLRPLPLATRNQVNEALQAIQKVMNSVSLAFKDSETLFDCQVAPNGALGLLYLLYEGLESRQQRKEDAKTNGYKRQIYPPEIF